MTKHFIILFFSIIHEALSCYGGGGGGSNSATFTAARSRAAAALGTPNFDYEMRAAKCQRADFGVYKASEMRQLATLYDIPGDSASYRSFQAGGKLACDFDSRDENCAWSNVPLEAGHAFRRARFETLFDLNRFDCTSDRSFPFTDYFLMAGGEESFGRAPSAIELAVPCQYDKATLKFDYWVNNERPSLKICIVSEESLLANCEESKIDSNPLTFEIPQSLKAFRIRILIEGIGDEDIVLLDNVAYDGTICELVPEDMMTPDKFRAEGQPILTPDNYAISSDLTLLSSPAPTTVVDAEVASREILPDSDIGDENNELGDLEQPRDICKALVCNFNFGNSCLWKLLGLAATSPWKTGESLLGNPHTGIHRHNPNDNRNSGYVYVGIDGSDLSEEVFVLESPRFKLNDPAYLIFDLYSRSMGPQLKICLNTYEDCPYSNPPLEANKYWHVHESLFMPPGTEKVYFIAAKVRQNLYLAVDNIRVENINNGSFCSPIDALGLPSPSSVGRKKKHRQW